MSAEKLKELVKLIVRAFYNQEYIIIMDLIINEKKITNEEISITLQINEKTINKILFDLVCDKILQQEDKLKDKRLHSYYFINYKLFLDSTKLRIERIKQSNKNKKEEIEVEHVCQNFNCNSIFESYEIQNLIEKNNKLYCTDCKIGEVIEEVVEKVEKVLDLNQLKRICSLLDKTDDLVFPDKKMYDPDEVMTKDQANIIKFDLNNRKKLQIVSSMGILGSKSKLGLNDYTFSVQIQSDEEIDEDVKEKDVESFPYFIKNSYFEEKLDDIDEEKMAQKERIENEKKIYEECKFNLLNY
jgi:transcription initiation factor IIE alpha subunit